MAWYDGIGAGVITGIANIGSSLLGMNFQKKENKITRSREDNAITRQVEDLRNAGMSPLLASGQGASAQSLSSPSFNLDGVGKGIEQALAVRQAKGQLDLMSSQRANNVANTLLAEANTKVANEQANAIKKQSDWMEVNGYRERSPIGALTQVLVDTYNAIKGGTKDGKNLVSDDGGKSFYYPKFPLAVFDSKGNSYFKRGLDKTNPFLRDKNKSSGGGRSW